MVSKGFLVLLTLAVIGDKGYVSSKPCFWSILDVFDMDSQENKPTKPLTPQSTSPQNITVYLTPVADVNSVQNAIQANPNGFFYLLPSLLPLGQSSPTTSSTTTTTTAAPPPAAAAAPAPAAAPPAAAPAAAAPAAGAAPAAAGAATPAPAAAG